MWSARGKAGRFRGRHAGARLLRRVLGRYRAAGAEDVRLYDPNTGRGGLSFEQRPEDGESAIDLIVNEYLAGRIKVRDGMLVKSETTRIAPRIGESQLAGRGIEHAEEERDEADQAQGCQIRGRGTREG